MLFALLGLGGAGCLIRGSLKSPSESGVQWVELRSKHFRLMTDLDADEADGVVRTFEQCHTISSATARAPIPPPTGTQA